MIKQFTFKLSLALIITLLALQSCNNNVKEQEAQPSQKRIFPQYSVYTENILKTDSSIIRGLNLNISSHIIKKAENVQPITDKTDTLVYQFQIDSIVSYSIKYTLNHDSLEEINLWVYSTNPDISAQIFNDLKDYYQKKLPNPIEDKGYVVYNCVQGERRPFVVSISDFSTPTKGQINLVIYKDK